jgi:putative ABC transport system substrate-binding protein
VTTRRKLLVAFGAGALGVPYASLAQQSSRKARRIGVLGSASASAYVPHVEALKAGLRDVGYVEGRDIAIEYRFAEGHYERLAELAAELLRLKPDVLVSHGTPATEAAKRATTSIPVVMVSIADPVASGLVASLARPGENLTGVSNLAGDVVAKHVELLAQVLTGRSALAVLRNPANPAATAPQLKEAEAAARSLGLRLQPFDARAAVELPAAFAAMAAARTRGVVVLSEPLFLDKRGQIAELAVRNRVATVFSRSEAVDAGGLMSYGPSLVGQFRQAAVYVDRILKGAKPADLPIEQPTKFELVVNIKTAKALGITIPQSILVRADRVIE